jgi:putative acetyltransferase
VTASRLEIIPARTKEDIAAIDGLFREYAQSISVDLEYQGFSAELAALPGQYAPPSGDLLLARINDEIAGCVALRALDDATLEMKRLYVRTSARGAGLGKRLVQDAISIAREKGYKELRLDTLGTMMAAQQLYRSLGFVEIQPYGKAAVAGTRFYALQLGA